MTTVKSRKAKGRRLQNLVKDCIIKYFKIPKEDVRAALMGESGTDIIITPQYKDIFPFAVECKNNEKISVWSAYEQAKKNAGEGCIPLVIMKKNQTAAIAILDAEIFFKIAAFPERNKNW